MWKSLVQDGSAKVVADGHWVAEMVHKPNRAQSGAMFQWEYIQQMYLHDYVIAVTLSGLRARGSSANTGCSKKQACSEAEARGFRHYGNGRTIKRWY